MQQEGWAEQRVETAVLQGNWGSLACPHPVCWLFWGGEEEQEMEVWDRRTWCIFLAEGP